MSVTARFTVSSSGAFRTLSRRAALQRTDTFPRTDRTAAGEDAATEASPLGLIWLLMGPDFISNVDFSFVLLIFCTICCNLTKWVCSWNAYVAFFNRLFHNFPKSGKWILLLSTTSTSHFFLICLIICNLSEAPYASWLRQRQLRKRYTRMQLQNYSIKAIVWWLQGLANPNLT